MNRSAAREETFKVLYSLEMQKKEETEEQIKLYIETMVLKIKKQYNICILPLQE